MQRAGWPACTHLGLGAGGPGLGSAGEGLGGLGDVLGVLGGMLGGVLGRSRSREGSAGGSECEAASRGVCRRERAGAARARRATLAVMFSDVH